MEVDDDICCDDEVQMFTENFKKQSKFGKRGLLRKLKEIIVPSTTSVLEPVVHKTNRGRPRLGTKQSNAKPQVPTSQYPTTQYPPSQESCRRSFSTYVPDNTSSNFLDLNQEPERHSMYSFREPSMFNSMFNQEQPSRRSNFNHVLMNEITSEFHPYITNIQNVDSDGHCGFRAVAASLGFGEENWRRIRSDLHNELLSHLEEYRAIYDVDVYSVNHSLDFYGSTATQPYWMIMSDTSFLIANTYGVIVHYLSKKGSSTCFPLWSGPQDIINHATVVISHVYGVHYVKVELQVGCPMPTVLQLWRSYRSSRAAGWETMYSGRLNAYVPPNAPRNSSDIDRVNVSDDC